MLTKGLVAGVRQSQTLYPPNNRVNIRVYIPQRLSLLTKPSIWLTLQSRIVRFVYFFIPLWVAIVWLMETVYSSRQVRTKKTTDFPEKMMYSEQAY